MRVNKINLFGFVVLFAMLILPMASAQESISTHEDQGSAYFDGYTLNVLHNEFVAIGEDTYVYGSFYDATGKLKDKNDAECIFGLLSPQLDRLLLLTEDNMTFANNDEIQVIYINGSFLYEYGRYTFNYNCDGVSGVGGFFHGSIMVNQFGKHVTDSDAMLYIGVMFFIFILSLVCMFAGGGMIKEGDNTMWGGIFLIGIGLVLLYGATFTASNIITNSNAMGGASVVSGFFLFFARALKYIPYLVTIMVIYFILKWRKSISNAHNFGDGWDDNNY